ERERAPQRRHQPGAVPQREPVHHRLPRGDGGDALPAARPEREAAAQAVEGPEARHAHRLAPVRDGRLEAAEDRRGERAQDLLLDDPGKKGQVKTLTIEIASDVVCPWCYIGKRRLEKALALLGEEVKPEIRWLPFQLNPDMPKGGIPRAEYRKAKFGS